MPQSSSAANINVDINQIATDLNLKADTDLINATPSSATVKRLLNDSSVKYIVETYSSGTNWYRVWSDGWCEQGGEVSKDYNNTTQTVSLLKQYVNTNYNVIFSLGGSAYSGVAQASWQNKTTSSFELYGDYSHETATLPTYWQACGYIE